MSTATLPRSSSAPAAPPPPDLVLAPLAALTLPKSPAVDVYASRPSVAPKLLWDGHARLGDDHLAEIRRCEERYSFWVARRDFNSVVTAAHAAWPEIAANRELPPFERFALCALVHALELQATVRLVQCAPHVKTAKRVAALAAAIFVDQPMATRDLSIAFSSAAPAPSAA